jgi:hypothetical protein
MNIVIYKSTSNLFLCPVMLHHSQILTKKPQFTFDAWEFRAFITSIIVAVTTIVLTGPFLVSYWIDYYTGTLLPQQVRFILLIPLVLNSILNPFIYAWRIPAGQSCTVGCLS